MNLTESESRVVVAYGTNNIPHLPCTIELPFGRSGRLRG
jgi:hypothetical protein